MQRKLRIVVVALVLISLTVSFGPAGAQEAPEGPNVGACLPGAGYASGCDVDQDGDIDIFDLQRTAGRWNSSGVYTSGHDHWGETWAGATGAHGLRFEHTAATGFTYGVYGESASSAGYGVVGKASAPSGITTGVYGESASSSGRGVYGRASNPGGVTFGVFGESAAIYGRGVYGMATATSGVTYGVFGYSASPIGYAGYFEGRAYVTTHLHVSGNISAGGTKTFKIDHPLDPANRYLYHFAQEAPEVQNVYNGVITLDSDGQAVVVLPNYFAALNTGAFRYQLTAIGAPMPNLHIARKIEGNTFRIAGGAAGQEVSWEVTAVRNDPYVRDHAIPAAVDKPSAERGTYLYPQGYGQPEELGLDYHRNAGFDGAPETAPPPIEGGE